MFLFLHHGSWKTQAKACATQEVQMCKGGTDFSLCGFLRGQAIDLPAAALILRIPQTVMQAIQAALPEFDRIGKEVVATPVRR
jgi:hypothetical protein